MARMRFLCALAAAIAATSSVFGSGFYLAEQSVSNMGVAHNGAACLDDPSTNWYNPAGITKLCGTQTSFGAHLVLPFVKFDNDESQANNGAGGIQMLTGGDGGNAGVVAAVPNFYVTKQLTDDLFLGLGINSPFGLETKYNWEWVGRYHANESAMLTININPNIAYRINNCLSVAAGFDVMYLHARLTNAVDFGLIGTILSGGALPVAPQQNDGKVRLTGNSWGYGGNAAVLWEPCRGLHISATYRSEIKHKISGKEKFYNIPRIFALAPPIAAAFQDTRAHSDVTLPSIASISGCYELNPCWSLVADATWVQWNRLKNLHFTFSNPYQADQTTTLNWKNTVRWGVGAIYKPNCEWTYRLGLAYDETPVPSKEYRSPRIPDQDRVWFAGGIGYRVSECIKVDLAYAYLYVNDDPRIDYREDFTDPANENFFKGGLHGKYSASTHIVSAQGTIQF